MAYNRPNHTKISFSKIENLKPMKLYISCDGPKNDIDNINVKKVREIIKKIDWKCDVNYLLNDHNLGCKYGCTNAINWFFENEEEGIILEDDCVVNPTFFTFCENLLKYYRNDNRIAMISGNLPYPKTLNESYFFSKFSHLWGWATWRGTWKYHDPDISYLDKLKQLSSFESIVYNKKERNFWLNTSNNIKDIDTWDWQLFIAFWSQSMLSIVPNVNLVSNIGFGIDATHTKNSASNQAMKTHEKMNFPLNHPDFIYADKLYDDFIVREEFCPTLTKRFSFHLKKLLNIK